MKQLICTILGVISSVIASFFGGWDAGFTTLLIFMGLEYISGLLVAGVFKNNPKTVTGAIESKVGWKGLCRKGMTRVFVEEISYFFANTEKILQIYLPIC